MIDRQPPTICDYLRANARHAARRIAVREGDLAWSWAELDDRSARIAAWCAGAGLAPGDRIGLLAATSANFVAAACGALRAGLSVVPLSTMLPDSTLTRLAEDAALRGLAVTAGHLEAGATLAGHLGLPESRRLSLDGPGSGFQPVPEKADGFPSYTPIPDDECNVIYSSGTTGLPKGIVHTHHSRLLRTISWMHEYGFTRETVQLLGTATASNATWVNLLPALMTGAASVMLPKFGAGAALDAIERHRVSHAFFVPTQIQRILADPSLPSRDLSSLRVVILGGSKVPVELKRRIDRLLPGRLHEIYGMTEGVSTALSPADLPDHIDSVGRPILGSEIVILDADGRELPPGQVGEIAGRSPAFMRGYLNRPDADAEICWHDADGRVFLRTGDIGRCDQDGYVYVIDRAKDMIVSGGVNIYASDLEDILIRHQAVAEVAVIAGPDPDWGETPAAVVILKPDRIASEEDLRVWANTQLGKYQRLSRVIIRREPFPRNHLEKIQKRCLVSQYFDK